MRELQFEKMDSDLRGHGVVIDTKGGFIYRLTMAPTGKSRVAKSFFNYESNTIIGPAIEFWDYDSPASAVSKFNKIKDKPDMLWRQDDRVFYQF